MTLSYKIIIGDSKSMDKIKNDSIQLIITSPPYANIKDYGHDNQIGFHPQFHEDVEKYTQVYLDEIKSVWCECYRILEEGCRLIINIGDVYLSSEKFGRYRILPIHAYILTQCVQLGFDYMGSIIWQKISSTSASGGVNANFMGSYPHPREPIIPFDYEYVMIFKKQGNFVVRDKDLREKSKLTKKEWIEYVKGHWYFKGEQQKEGHPAIFPIELPKRLIKMYSFYGETVLDCFLGSGSTMRSARDLHRNCIGYELNEDYLELIKEKVLYHQRSVTDQIKFKILK